MNLNKYLQQTDSLEVKSWINSNLKNYLEKKDKEENVGEIEHIIDYLNSPKAPNRLKKMSYKEARKGAEKWVKTMTKKAKNIIETEEDTKVIKTYDGGLRFVKLVGKSAFQREGKLMSHCVASYYDKKDCEVYSLRDAKNNPHCTIEILVKNKQVNQIKGKGNGSIHPKYVKPIIDILKNFFKLDIRDSELVNLGYSKLDSELYNFVSNNFSGVKFITFNGSNYFYNNSKLVRKD